MMRALRKLTCSGDQRRGDLPLLALNDPHRPDGRRVTILLRKTALWA
jgi:hypothetical protein